MKSILFTICARAGSKGVKNKNVKELCGIPLVNYTLAAYVDFKMNWHREFNDIDLAVNTDSDTLIKQIEATGIEFTLVERDEDLAGDVVSKSDVIKATFSKMEALKHKSYDLVVDLDLTSPIRSDEDIAGCINALNESTNADISYSVVESRRSPYFNMVKKGVEDYYECVIPSEIVSRQQSIECYDMNASIYVYSKQFLLNKNYKYVLDGKGVIWQMLDTLVLDIDSEEDYEMMEFLFSYYSSKYCHINNIYEKAHNL